MSLYRFYYFALSLSFCLLRRSAAFCYMDYTAVAISAFGDPVIKMHELFVPFGYQDREWQLHGRNKLMK